MDESFSLTLQEESSFDQENNTQITILSEDSQQISHKRRQTLKKFTKQFNIIKQNQENNIETYYKEFFREIVENTGSQDSRTLYFLSMNNITNQVYCQQIIRDPSIAESVEYILNNKDIYTIDLSRCKKPYLVTPNNVYILSSVEGGRSILYCDYIQQLNKYAQSEENLQTQIKVEQTDVSTQMQPENIQKVHTKEQAQQSLKPNYEDIETSVAHIKGPFFENMPLDEGIERLSQFLITLARQAKIQNFILVQPLFKRALPPKVIRSQQPKNIDFSNPFDVMKFVLKELGQLRRFKIYVQAGRNDPLFSSQTFPQTCLVQDEAIKTLQNPESVQIGSKIITFADLDVTQFKCLTNLPVDNKRNIQTSGVQDPMSESNDAQKNSDQSPLSSQENTNVGSSRIKINIIEPQIKIEQQNTSSDIQLVRFVNSETQILTTSQENVPQQEQHAFTTRFRNFAIAALINGRLIDQIPFLPRNYQLSERFDGKSQVFSIINEKFTNPIAIVNPNEDDSLLLASGGVFSSSFLTVVTCKSETVEARKVEFQVSK